MTGQYGLIYRLLFFYIEPISALGGAYLTHFTPQKYYSIVLPSSSYTTSPLLMTTELQLALTNLASSYVYFTIMEAVLLRVTNDRNVWRVAILGMLVNDLIHLWGLWVARGDLGWDFGRYGDWETWVPTYVPLGLRVAFLVGWDGWSGGDENVKKNV
ncbi:hypothetical protein TWF694_004946 [Orbilia ellipsospora]|uniref:DUF7704 domain-containing protein n=1 Tax=Orbilia ellipsospora TaxID=2528407 RepID=A0AAV9WU37_9PEZI